VEKLTLFEFTKTTRIIELAILETDGITTTTCVLDVTLHIEAGAPVLAVGPTLAVHAKSGMKFFPVTVIVLLTYPAAGATDVAFGDATTRSVVPATAMVEPELMKVTSTEEAVPEKSEAAVPGPITTTTCVLDVTLHIEAGAPVLAVGPTLAVHAKSGMKFFPVTVIVLLTYPAAGATDVAFGDATTRSVVPATAMVEPELMKVTSTEEAVPEKSEAAVPGPITTTTCVLDVTLHIEAGAPVLAVGPTLAVHAKSGMKFFPVTVIVLLTYPAAGATDVAFGDATTRSVVPATAMVEPELMKVTSTEEAVPEKSEAAVPGPITTTTCVLDVTLHIEAGAPVLAVGPTLAVHAKSGMKFFPVTVIVLLTYPAAGATDVAFGDATTRSVVPATAMVEPELMKVTSTEEAVPEKSEAAVPGPITTTTCVLDVTLHIEAGAPVLAVGPTLAVHAKSGMKFFPVTVIVLLTYPAAGATDVAFGDATTRSVVPATAMVEPELMKVTSTEEAVPEKSEAAVPGPITTTTCVLDVTLHIEAGAPVLAVGPTLAVHAKSGMKLFPEIVKVLPLYAMRGAIASAVIPDDDRIGSVVVCTV
jgi:hypothetical protein